MFFLRHRRLIIRSGIVPTVCPRNEVQDQKLEQSNITFKQLGQSETPAVSFSNPVKLFSSKLSGDGGAKLLAK